MFLRVSVFVLISKDALFRSAPFFSTQINVTSKEESENVFEGVVKIVNALRDCNLLIFCGYPRDMADMPMQRKSHDMLYRKYSVCVCPN